MVDKENIKTTYLKVGLKLYNLCVDRIKKKSELEYLGKWNDDLENEINAIHEEIKQVESELEEISKKAWQLRVPTPFDKIQMEFQLKKEEKYILLFLFFKQFADQCNSATISELMGFLDIPLEWASETYVFFENLLKQNLIIPTGQCTTYIFTCWNVSLSPAYSKKIARYFFPIAPEVEKKIVNNDKNKKEDSEDKFCLLDIRKPLFSLEQIVLPQEQKETIKRIVSQVKLFNQIMKKWEINTTIKYGKGIVLLFYGPPGTGKTATCEAIAHSLNKKIGYARYSNMLSRWVGESEKYVEEVFANARAADCVMVFDEADSLFGRRLNEFHSTDRMHNYLTNILMQIIEKFEGVVILTTNREVVLDEAFYRRILIKMKFDIPGPEERAQLWKILIPEKVPLNKDVDFGELGKRFKLTGGEIKNAILKALMDCADRKLSKLPMYLLVKYAEEEQQKSSGHGSKIGFNKEKNEIIL
ncbi:MAG: ATP-binding protein [candidate division WOR-3 bacterium]|nr:ATP-binding protein [candidate division WOR-3 bacterium]